MVNLQKAKNHIWFNLIYNMFSKIKIKYHKKIIINFKCKIFKQLEPYKFKTRDFWSLGYMLLEIFNNIT